MLPSTVSHNKEDKLNLPNIPLPLIILFLIIVIVATVFIGFLDLKGIEPFICLGSAGLFVVLIIYLMLTAKP